MDDNSEFVNPPDSDPAKLTALNAYLGLGWALVPLHDVSAGRCSCTAGAQCPNAGKHPRRREWQMPHQLVRDTGTLTALAGAHPEWNWGAATGRISGIWALDIDPEHDGFERLAELEERHGALPTTRVHRTGSAGEHRIFRITDYGDGWTPRNVQRSIRESGRVPAGIDVRGEGGQIVLPPSVSGKGPYVVWRPVPVVAAPGWLDGPGGLLRPPEVSVPPGVGVPTGPGVGHDVIGGADRGAAYAAAAVRAELDVLRAAQVGTRNDTAYAVACRLNELVNAPWAGLDPAAVHNAWWEAAAAHPDGAYVPVAELDGIWRRAQARVGATAASLPPPAWGEFVPFSAGPAVPSPGWTGTGIRTGIGGQSTGQFPEQNLIDPGQGVSGGGQVTGMSGGSAGNAVDPVQAMLGAMLTSEQMAELPNPEPLIAGLLDVDTCAWLIGESGSYKTFVALDFAAHVASGRAWRGHAVRQGRVVVVVGEGARGMKLRAQAWEREYNEGKPMDGVLFLPAPVQADERRGAGGWSVLVEACRRIGPVLVVLDTQARMTLGLNENDNGDMGFYAAQVDRLRQATGACVLSVHHVGRSGTNARGASALDAAQDAELRTKWCGKLRIELYSDKQKDQEQQDPIGISLRRSEGGTDPATGRDLSSLVLDHPHMSAAGDPFLDPAGPPVEVWRTRALLLRSLLLRYGNPGDGLSQPDLRRLFFGQSEISDLAQTARYAAFKLAWNELVGRGLMAKRYGQQLYKIIELQHYEDDGLLTVNPRDGAEPAEGWGRYHGDDES